MKKQFVRMVDGWILGFLKHLFPGLTRGDDKARAKPLKLPVPKPNPKDKSWYCDLFTRVDKKSVLKFKSGSAAASLSRAAPRARAPHPKSLRSGPRASELARATSRSLKITEAEGPARRAVARRGAGRP